MTEWQKRLIKEYIDLRLKVLRLHSYVEDNANDNIDLLSLQETIMLSYLRVLELRGQKYKINLSKEFAKRMKHKRF